MFFYSHTINAFRLKAKALSFEILHHECQLEVHRDRFTYKGVRIPLQIVVFEHPRELGFCDPASYCIGLHRRLMFEAKTEVLKNILRHELAHLLASREYGLYVEAHGPEFRQMCRDYGWGEEVFRATSNLDNENAQAVLAREDWVLEKVKKLLALAQSQNAHEKEAATIKANELLTKYNLDHARTMIGSAQFEAEEICQVRAISFPKTNQKYLAISSILKHFFVYPVLCRYPGKTYLEVSGTRTNVEIAVYVAEFLDRALEDLWQEAKKTQGLQGKTMKNSFFAGVARGHDKKMEEAKAAEGASTDEAKFSELVVLEKQLAQRVRTLVYRNLGSVHSRAQSSPAAHAAGLVMGKNLQIRAGVGSGQSMKYLN